MKKRLTESNIRAVKYVMVKNYILAVDIVQYGIDEARKIFRKDDKGNYLPLYAKDIPASVQRFALHSKFGSLRYDEFGIKTLTFERVEYDVF